MNIRIYTDGVCSGHPGHGGWACLLLAEKNGEWKRAISHSGGYRLTTNNRMELMAAIQGLKSLVKDGNTVEIFSDSRYVCRYNDFIISNAHFDQIANDDLWKELYTQVERQSSVVFTWIPGHSGESYNIECDKMAVAASKEKGGQLVDEVYETTVAKRKEEFRHQMSIARKDFQEHGTRKPSDAGQPPASSDSQANFSQEMPLSIGCVFSGAECHVALVIGGFRFFSEKGFDMVSEANRYKEDLLQQMMSFGLHPDA